MYGASVAPCMALTMNKKSKTTVTGDNNVVVTGSSNVNIDTGGSEPANLVVENSDDVTVTSDEEPNEPYKIEVRIDGKEKKTTFLFPDGSKVVKTEF